MAPKHNTKRRADAPTREADRADQPPESLDQVRDILFGGQMRAVESRLERMEGRVMREVEAARDAAAAQRDALDANLRKEMGRLGEKLQAERTKRAEDLKALSAEVRKSVKDLDKRLAALDNAASKADAELRDQILEQAKTASTNLARVADELRETLKQEAHELRAEKADTAALIGLFSDMALRLTEELPSDPHD